MSGTVGKGTRIGAAFKGMITTCPLEITSYTKCVVEQDLLEKNSCAKEFEALKKCFRQARKSPK